jgi:hypothetical protein
MPSRNFLGLYQPRLLVQLKREIYEHAAVALAEARSMPDLFHWITARAQPDAGQELRIARSVRCG